MPPAAAATRSRARRRVRAAEALFAALLGFAPLAHGAVEPWSVAAVEAGVLAIALLWLSYEVNSGVVLLRRTPADPWLAALLAIGALSLLGSVDAHAGRLELMRWSAYALLYLVLVQAGRNPRRLAGMAWAATLTGGVLGGLALTARSLEVIGLSSFHAIADRIAFPFPNHSHFASFEAAAALIGLGLALGARPGGRASAGFVALVAALVATLAAVFALSRGALLGFALGLAVLGLALASGKAGRGRAALLGLFAGGVLLLVVGLGGEAVRARLATLADPARAGSVRIAIWRGTLAMIRDRPLGGAGLAAYPAAFPRFQPAEVGRYFVNHAHSDYLELAADVGLPGLAVALLGLGTFGASVWRALARQTDLGLQATGSGALAALASLAAHWAIDFDGHVTANVVLLATAAALAHGCGRVAAVAAPPPLRIEIRPGRRRRWQLALAGAAGTALLAVLAPWIAERLRRAAGDHARALDFGRAGRRLALARAIDPGNPALHAAEGDLAQAEALASGEARRRPLLERSIASYDRAIELCPVCTWLHARKAVAARSLGARALEERSLLRAVELGPTNPAARFDLASYYLRIDRTEPALGEFERYLQLDGPRMGEVLERLYYRVSDVEELRRIVPVSAPARRDLADFLFDKGVPDLAVGELERALALDPSLERGLDLLRGQLRGKRFEEVLATAGRIRERHGGGPRIARLEGLALDGLGRTEAAREVFAELIAVEPREAANYVSLAALHRRAGDYDRAAAVLRRGMAVLPGEARLASQLGLVLREAHRPAEALEGFREAVAIAPRAGEYRWQLGEQLRQMGLVQEAAEEWRACLAAAPREARCRTSLATLAAGLGIDPREPVGEVR